MPVDMKLAQKPFICPVDSSIPQSDYFQQDGFNVYRAVLEEIPDLIRKAVQKANLKPSDIKLVVPHQGSGKMVDGIQKKFILQNGSKEFEVFKYVEEGNFSSASILVALAKAIEQGRVQKGDRVVLAGFGAGLFSSIAVIQV